MFFDKDVEETPQVSVCLGNTNISLKQIDINEDELININENENTNFDSEKKIFSSMLDNSTNAKLNDEVVLNFDKEYQEVTVYDHLLNDDGYSYFNKSINQYNLSINNDIGTIILSEHPALTLSSDSTFLKDKELRGFRIVIKTSDKVYYEYAFTLKLTK